MMKKRKAIALLLSLVLLLCNSISVVAAEPAHVEAVDSASEMESSTVDLSEICSVQPYADGWNIATTESPILTEIDFSNAVSVDLSYGDMQDLEGISELPVNDGIVPMADNQNPVASPVLDVLNYDSLKPDGSFTTETEFILLTRLGGEDLVYDPDGDNLTLLWNESFPSAFIKGVARDPDGAWAGYVFQLFNPGTYPFAFAFIDDKGGASESGSFVFEIQSRGDFETIEGALSSITDTNSYDITVDYSTCYEYTVGFLRTGTSGFSVEVQNPDGSKVSSTSCTGPSYDQSVRSYISLKQPSGITGSYTYTVKVSAPAEKYYVDGDLSYRIAYGKASESEFFFEGANNSLNLPYYHTVRSWDQIEGQFGSSIEASEYGDYYKIDTTGTETVTLTSTYGQYRFKVLGCQSFETLYDGGSLDAFKNEFSFMDLYSTRADINFANGESYYVVVYKIRDAQPAGGYDLTVGEPAVTSNSFSIEIPSQNVVKGQPYEWSFALQTPTGRPGYVDYVNYSASGAGWPYEGGYYSVLTPGTSTWAGNILKYSKRINFDYRDINAPLRRADGTWKFGFTAGETGTYPGRTLQIFYVYEF